MSKSKGSSVKGDPLLLEKRGWMAVGHTYDMFHRNISIIQDAFTLFYLKILPCLFHILSCEYIRNMVSYLHIYISSFVCYTLFSTKYTHRASRIIVLSAFHRLHSKRGVEQQWIHSRNAVGSNRKGPLLIEQSYLESHDRGRIARK